METACKSITLYPYNTYHIVYGAGPEMQTVWPRMGAPLTERTPHMPEMPITLLESGPESEEVMGAPKDPAKHAEWRKKISETRKERGLSKGDKNPFYTIRFCGEDHYLYGKTLPEETRKKISKTRKERGVAKGEKNPMYGVHLSGELNPNYGKPLSEETKRKLSEAMTGRKLSQEAKKNISEGLKGRKFSEEHRKKISEANKGRNTILLKGIPRSEEVKKKISEAQKGKFVSEETRKKLAAVPHLRGPDHPRYGKPGMIGEKNPRWKGGVSFEPYCVKFNNEFKERVREFFGRKCVECGMPEIENGRKLDVHHVNYRKDACCEDHVIPLFVALCQGCHVKPTHEDREYWEERFTTLINEEYGGQCYLPKKEAV